MPAVPCGRRRQIGCAATSPSCRPQTAAPGTVYTGVPGSWRGGRAAEGTRLLSEYGQYVPSRVRIPPSPSRTGPANRALPIRVADGPSSCTPGPVVAHGGIFGSAGWLVAGPWSSAGQVRPHIRLSFLSASLMTVLFAPTPVADQAEETSDPQRCAADPCGRHQGPKRRSLSTVSGRLDGRAQRVRSGRGGRVSTAAPETPPSPSLSSRLVSVGPGSRDSSHSDRVAEFGQDASFVGVSDRPHFCAGARDESHGPFSIGRTRSRRLPLLATLAVIGAAVILAAAQSLATGAATEQPPKRER